MVRRLSRGSLFIALLSGCDAASATAESQPELHDSGPEIDAPPPQDASTERERPDADADTLIEAGSTSACSAELPPLSGGDTAGCYDCAVTRCIAPLCGCDSDCLRFQYLLGGCDEQLDLQGLEACLYAGQKETPSLDLAHAAFVAAGGIDCLIRKCSSPCVPAASHPCAQCRQACCASQSDAFAGSAAAQDVAWCRSYCASADDEVLCNSDCPKVASSHEEIANALAVCSNLRCTDLCAAP